MAIVDGAMRRLFLMVLLLVSSLVLFGGLDLLPVAHAQAGVSVVSVYPVYETGIKVGVLFPVQVRLSLADGQSINAFDVQMNYTYDPAKQVLQPESIDYSTNSILAGSQVNVLSNCIDGIESGGTNCPAGEGPGTIHFAEVLVGNKLTGPVSGNLFTVNFRVLNIGKCYFSLAANLADPGVFPYPAAQFIPEIAQGGVFGNTGVVAFFNVVPSSGPAALPGHDVIFDASGSFSNSTAAIVSYAWNFGDGTSTPPIPTANYTYRFAKPGSYLVALNVTDSDGKSGVWSSVVGVLPALGSLKLTVVDRELGNPISGSVAVKLFNNSLTLTGMNASLDSSGHVIFDRLVLGSYVLKISGPSIEAYSKTETVSLEGWPTQDTIYLNVIHQGPNINGDLIFIGSLVGAVGVVTVGVFAKRRNSRKKRTAGHNRAKTRSRIHS